MSLNRRDFWRNEVRQQIMDYEAEIEAQKNPSGQEGGEWTPNG
ncbi:hypothetical protein [Sulfurovum sp.]|nr:hypothetical protein [Sulfurovum sp.]